ncbi:hypothetical protein EDC05_001865 [Coemansia umbellata]|nr:hypothetical protein EDC05_001865 [Coemansia umbellata]
MSSIRMWAQAFILALAFGLGYYFSTAKNPQPGESAHSPTKSSVGQEAGDDTHETKDRKKSKRSKKRPKKQPIPAEANEDAAADKQAATGSSTLETNKPDTAEPEMDELEADASDWEAVTASAQPVERRPAAIPVHDSLWHQLEPEEALDGEPLQVAPTRILRIGAPAQPPRKPPQPRTHYTTAPEPLTKKQRQTRRKTQMLREQRAQNAAAQEERLRQHQRELMDIRSREQWEKAKRKQAAKKAQSQKPNAAGPSFIDGKLIWD